MSDELLDSVLDLEETSYQAGFDEGKGDGTEAGHKEGLTFGIEKGYQKALELGKLHGRALMLNARLSEPIAMPGNSTSLVPSTTQAIAASKSDSGSDNLPSQTPELPKLPENPRLKKHIETLLKLTDPETISLENSDEAVDECDERMKKAIAKAKVIDKLIAEPYSVTVSGENEKGMSQPAAVSGSIEELSNQHVRR